MADQGQPQANILGDPFMRQDTGVGGLPDPSGSAVGARDLGLWCTRCRRITMTRVRTTQGCAMSLVRRPSIDRPAERGKADPLVADLRDPGESVPYITAEAFGHVGEAPAIAPPRGGYMLVVR